MSTITVIYVAIFMICFLIDVASSLKIKQDNDKLLEINESIICSNNYLFDSCVNVTKKYESVKHQLITERKKLHALQNEYFNDKDIAMKLVDSAEKFMNNLPEGID